MRQALWQAQRAIFLGVFVVLLATTMQCMDESVAVAQEGLMPSLEQSIEDRLSIPGPITMDLIWDYLIANFGEPQLAQGVVLFDVAVIPEDGITHIQFVQLPAPMVPNGASFHMDIPFEEGVVGGAITNDEMFKFIWICNTEDVDITIGCMPPEALTAFMWDFEGRAVYYWQERIDNG